MGGSLRGQLAPGADLPRDSHRWGLPAGHMLSCHRQQREGPPGCHDTLLQEREENRHALSGEMAYSSTQASGTDVGHGQMGTWAWVVEETPKVWREQGQCEERGLAGLWKDSLVQPDCPFSSHFVSSILPWTEMIFFLLGVMRAYLRIFLNKLYFGM